MGKLFNAEVKERYLKTLNSSSQYMYRKVLEKIAVMERFYNKDVSNFIYEEYTKLLYSLNAKSLVSIGTQHSIIRNYIQFAVDNGAASPNRLVDNVAAMFTKDDLVQFIRHDAKQNQIISSEELDELIDLCYNPQDAALIQALREGIKGTSCTELINLKINDINPIGFIDLYDKDTERVITVSRKTIRLLIEAHKQDKYWRNNGESNNKKAPYFYLPKTEYIFKPTGKNNYEQVNDQILRRRLKVVAEWYGNPFLNITNIWLSGIVEYAQKLMQKYNVDKLSTEHYKEICYKYGINTKRIYYIRQLVEEYVNN